MKIRKPHTLLLGAAIALPLALTLALPFAAMADPHEDGSRHHGRSRLFLVLRIAEELDLSDEKALAVNHALEAAEGKREELRTKRHELNDQIRAELEKPKPSDAKLDKLIDQSFELDRQRAKSLEESFDGLKKVLTVPQQAKLVLLRARMHREANPHDDGFHSKPGGRWRRHGDGHRDGHGSRTNRGPHGEHGGGDDPSPAGDKPGDEG